jgi:hypothetical protein
LIGVGEGDMTAGLRTEGLRKRMVVVEIRTTEIRSKTKKPERRGG